jgi:O-antigen/teichoic acid export membrane protein
LSTNSKKSQDSYADQGAVPFSLWFRVWQGLSIFVTIPLLLTNLDSKSQGVYYLLLAIASTQAFFEMGLGLIIKIRASHEWVHLRVASDGSVMGDGMARARLKGLCNISLKFSLTTALVFLIICAIAGYQFAEIKDISRVENAYIKYIVLITGIMAINPLIYVVEGCNNVGGVAIFRLIQSAIGAITLWLSLQLGNGIHSLVFQALSLLLCAVAYIIFKKRNFFLSIYLKSTKNDLSWKKDFLPHQWRLAIQSIFNMLAFPFFQFMSFKMLGATESGKLGLTLQIALGIQGLSLVFINAKIPHFSILAARGEVVRLKHEWTIQITKSLIFMLASFIFYIVALSVIAWKLEAFYVRILGVRETLILISGLLATTYISGVAAITRAHKVERFTVIGACAGLGYGGLATALCQYFGNAGIVSAHAMVTLFFVLPATYHIMNQFTRERMVV